jgi:8-oxo-dGTP diphosphatase
MPFTYDYPRPMVTADCLIFSGAGDELRILLIRRGHEPYRNMWALPGGFLEMDEELEECALRELKEETGLTGVVLNQLFTVGTPGRDPRGRTITVLYYGFAYYRSDKLKAGDDASDIYWFLVNKLPPMAFDHTEVIRRAVKELKLLCK